MTFQPLVRMWKRVDVDRHDSDQAFFQALMYAGELLTKSVVAGLASAIDEDSDRTRYRVNHALVRADGIGDWSKALDDILTGPPAQVLLPEARAEQRELTQRVGPGVWQFDSTAAIHSALSVVDPTIEPLGTKIDGRNWLRLFARLRNKTRGHGAPTTDQLSRMCTSLDLAIRLFELNFNLFKREWVFLRRTLAGKYRVTRLAETSHFFDHLRSTKNASLPDGVYVHMGRPCLVELCESDADFLDFFLANGGFSDSRYELLSYVSGDTIYKSSAPFLEPIGTLPGSETEGKGELDIVGNCFSNLPDISADYIHRTKLEKELLDSLRRDRHQVVTLVGRGGIGKTSLALATCRAVAQEIRFSHILWFSARDLDLLTDGPKRVRPAVVNVKDIGDTFCRLMGVIPSKERRAPDLLADALGASSSDVYLFVFDNFETVVNPVELYTWIDTYIRAPNKVLITTRRREFKGDYPIEVLGMTDAECEQLIGQTASRLGITQLLNTDYREALLRESDRHPYVVKILLGEVSKAGRLKSIERIVAESDDILPALFERTYNNLSVAAQRVFLTLCSWRSVVPALALEAVLLRPQNERVPVRDAIDELDRSSLVEVVVSESDGQAFVSTPLVASEFGRRKLQASSLKTTVEADTELLQQFGAGQKVDVRHGVAPRVQRVLRFIAGEIASGKATVEHHRAMLEFIARHHSDTWLSIADLYEESGRNVEAREAVRRFLEDPQVSDTVDAWRRLARLCKVTNDVVGEVHALVEQAEREGVEFRDVSWAANRVNQIFVNSSGAFESEEKLKLVVRLVDAIEKRSGEAAPTDLSRLAWLCLHLKDEARARRHLARGLAMEPDHEHLIRLKQRLDRSVDGVKQS